jgi:DNA-binding NarL/FixJ family response regulator
MSRKTIRVLIVDDHAIVREGYRALLVKHEGLKVVGEACDAASAYQRYKDTRPDVVGSDHPRDCCGCSCSVVVVRTHTLQKFEEVAARGKFGLRNRSA